MTKFTKCLLLAVVVAYLAGYSCCHAETKTIPPVVVDYFYEAGCPDCIRVKERILPELEN